MIKKILNCYILILLIAFVLIPNMLLAQETVMPGGMEFDCKNPCNGQADNEMQTGDTETELNRCKQYCGEYEVNDFFALGVRVSNIILGIVGSLALLAFVVGGVMFLASAGNKNLVDRGKATIIGAVIGLLVVFASYTIISFAADAMGVETTSGKSIFQTDWFN
ncbi:MAG: hypothetical protein U9M94_00155 [Patescibacteria group bacterium]|nr:hypothetical protein [Patescibacteria group bacterium]